jgi:23S rRNA pseudouridine1911/1915/1917 synthase
MLPGQALHAKTLGFIHPETGEMLHFEKAVNQGLEQLLLHWKECPFGF